ncbi:unnamed protein product [Blepharisma stoltei]|uniref:Uncharacterized protein n=1 Tax=Blepharisma stoltei TaxID=1481888 RepID=A0AAU9K8M2_9CILI|nr:unnamed protein product [Blepharisma stoltei]
MSFRQTCPSCMELQSSLDDFHDKLSTQSYDLQKAQSTIAKLISEKVSLENKLSLSKASLETHDEEQTILLQTKVDNLIADLIERDNTLSTAKQIIKKLNHESEEYARTISELNSQVAEAKTKSKQFEALYLENVKGFQEIEVLKKTEQRIKAENFKLKEQIDVMKEESAKDIADLENMIKHLITEKGTLEELIGELEIKLGEIDKANGQRENLYQDTQNRIKELEEEIERKNFEIKQQAEDWKTQKEQTEIEVNHMRRAAENMIRQLRSMVGADVKIPELGEKINQKIVFSKNSGKKDPQVQNQNSQAHTDIYKMNSEEMNGRSLEREMKLLKFLSKLVKSEGKHFANEFENLEKKLSLSRAETEKWIMRNEELEIILNSHLETEVKLFDIISKLKKTIIVKNQHLGQIEQSFADLLGILHMTIENFEALRLNTKIESNNLSQTSENLESAIADWKSQIDMFKTKIEDAMVQNEKLFNDNSAWNKVVVKKNQELLSINDELESFQKISKKLEEELDTTNNEIANLQKYNKQLEEELEKFNKQEAKLISSFGADSVEKAIEIFMNIQENCKDALNQLAHNEAEKKEFIGRVSKLQSEIENLNELVRNKEKSILEIKIASKNAENDFLCRFNEIEALINRKEEIEKDLKEENQRIKKELEIYSEIHSKEMEEITMKKEAEIKKLWKELEEAKIAQTKTLNDKSEIDDLKSQIEELKLKIKEREKYIELLQKTQQQIDQKILSPHNNVSKTIKFEENTRDENSFINGLLRSIKEKNDQILDLERELRRSESQNNLKSQVLDLETIIELLSKKMLDMLGKRIQLPRIESLNPNVKKWITPLFHHLEEIRNLGNFYNVEKGYSELVDVLKELHPAISWESVNSALRREEGIEILIRLLVDTLKSNAKHIKDARGSCKEIICDTISHIEETEKNTNQISNTGDEILSTLSNIDSEVLQREMVDKVVKMLQRLIKRLLEGFKFEREKLLQALSYVK